ncbi:hypothetical protein L3Q82_014041, partial [Scortum barcoo]
MAAIKALELWCKTHCEGYRDVAITNMTTSFRDGLAFCALIHKYRPDLIDYDSLRKEDVFENNRLVAEEELGIPALLDAEDMVALRIPDRLSILTYVSQYYNYFKGRPPMGGVKRPAEGSKEEPSERKKNLPVVAKTFVSKTAIQNRLPSSLTAQTSPKLVKAAAQTAVLAENANKNGTLNSKCVACKSHVHLVQRHFVESKLYHRSCFKCSECSSVLHAGGYKPGKNPDTFICKAHQNSCKPSSCKAAIKNGPASSAARLNGAIQTQPAPRPSSVLSAPLSIVVKPVSPTPPSQSWTASAQKTQSARQRFFQAAAPPITEASTGNRKPAEPSSFSERPKVPRRPDDDEMSRTRTIVGKKLAEENCNNNNKRPFTIRSAERRLMEGAFSLRRFGDEPSSADSSSLRKNTRSQGPAGNWAGQPSTSQTNNKESPCLKAINKDSTRPTTVHTTAKGKHPGCEWQSKDTPLKTEPSLKEAPAEAFAEQHKPGITSTTSSNVSISATRPPLAPTPAAPPVGFALFDPAHVRDVPSQKPQPGSGNLGAKKGKYLSPTNASRTEMRSPSVKSYHIPVEQIEKELNDIETNLAQLEKEGVELEKRLRSCEEEGKGDILMDPLMVDWFNLIRKKQMYIRKESELVYTARTQELEEQQPGVEGELRRLLEKPGKRSQMTPVQQRLGYFLFSNTEVFELAVTDHLKSREEQQREKKLLQRLMEIVDSRNAIVEGLDEDRLREVEEDQQLNEMMQNL